MASRIDRNQPIIVCGGGGFIGGHLVGEMLKAGHKNVISVDKKPLDGWYQVHREATNIGGPKGDLMSMDNCRRVMKGRSGAKVFQLAADMGGMGFIETHKAECMLSVLINTQMLLAAKEVGVDRFFYSSSACVYNADKQRNADVTALKEEDAYPAMPEDGYGWEKLFSERMCRHFLEDFGVQCRVARFHNVYGPFGTWEGGREKAPAAICRKVIAAKHTGRPQIEIWGDGEQTRSFMYITDCTKGIRMFTDADKWFEPLNLGSSELVSINQLVSIAEEIAGVKLERSYKLDAPKGVRGRNSDNTNIQARFGWEPDTRLRDGMAQTYAWIEQEWLAKYGPGSKTVSAPARGNGKHKASKGKAKASGKKKAKSRSR
ncbi:MAG TPA: NAD-dependent epimerase/dehydratase family protein [Phycisphaerales bacterium]|jgi:nucleoside-diphosphate-sugar epimerase|nr:NAD-dependent epimerase/dehydratase family protein [Phycisphaerales bacterium]